MLKIVGIISVITACSGLGLYKAFGIRVRYHRLRDICVFIEEISDRIRTGEELSKIMEVSGKRVGISVSGYEVKICPDGLKSEDIRLLKEFSAQLGMGDTSTQLKRCEVYYELLKKQEKEAAENSAAKTSLYGKLGFFVGLFAAIMLI